MSGTRAAYEDWHGRLPVDAGAAAPWHELVLAHLDPDRDLRGRAVLEMACGRGGFAMRLAALAPPRCLCAEDFAVTAVRMGRAHAGDRPGVRWIAGDAQRIAHADGSFDTVISCETIEHVPDPAGAVREFARVLKRGGRLFLTTPNYLGAFGVYRAYRRLTGRPYTEEGQPINHVMLLPRTLALVRRAGLRVCIVDGTGHYVPVPRRAPVRIAALDRMRGLTRWTALHSFVLAEKP